MKNRTITSAINADVIKMIDIIVLSFIKKGYISYQEKEDYHQDLVLFFLEKCVNFSNNKGLIFTSIRNAAYNRLKYSSYRKHMSLNELLEYNFDIRDENDTLSDIEDRAALLSLLRGSSEIDRMICEDILNDMSIEKISKKYSMAKISVYNKLRALGNKK